MITCLPDLQAGGLTSSGIWKMKKSHPHPYMFIMELHWKGGWCHTTMWMYLTHLDCILKMVKMGNFVRHVLPQLKINFKMQEIKRGAEYNLLAPVSQNLRKTQQSVASCLCVTWGCSVLTFLYFPTFLLGPYMHYFCFFKRFIHSRKCPEQNRCPVNTSLSWFSVRPWDHCRQALRWGTGSFSTGPKWSPSL